MQQRGGAHLWQPGARDGHPIPRRWCAAGGGGARLPAPSPTHFCRQPPGYYCRRSREWLNGGTAAGPAACLRLCSRARGLKPGQPCTASLQRCQTCPVVLPARTPPPHVRTSGGRSVDTFPPLVPASCAPGIGPEIAEAVQKIFKAAGAQRRQDWERADQGQARDGGSRCMPTLC